MVEIELNDGNEPILLRSYEFGWETCWSRKRFTNPDKTEFEMYWAPGKWYPILPQALNAIAEFKLRNSDATTLTGLVQALGVVRKELTEIYSTTIVKKEK